MRRINVLGLRPFIRTERERTQVSFILQRGWESVGGGGRNWTKLVSKAVR